MKMLRYLASLLLLITLPLYSQTQQTINVKQLRPSTTNTWVITTVDGQVVWAQQQGRCGHDFIPCLNTPNTWLTGEQRFQAGDPNTVPVILQGAPGGFSTGTFVQGIAGSGGGGFGHCVLTFPNPVTPGNMILAINITGSAAVVFDNHSAVYTQVGSSTLGNGGSTIFVSPNAVGGTTTLDFSNTGQVNGCMIEEFSGIALANPVDAISVTGGNAWAGSTPSIGPITTTNANDLIVTWVLSGVEPFTTTPGTYTLTYTDHQNATAALPVSATNTFSVVWNSTGGGTYFAGIMALKAASPLYQTAPLLKCQDWTGADHCQINSLGQYIPPSYIGGATNVPDGPAVAYDSTKNCLEYYNVGLSAWNPLCNHAAPTVVNCSGSGNVSFSLVDQAINYKKVIVYANACTGTASYSYAVAFTHTPQIISQSLTAAITSLSITAVTFTGSASTGFVELDGY